jgi:hypothetical protein
MIIKNDVTYVASQTEIADWVTAVSDIGGVAYELIADLVLSTPELRSDDQPR